MTTATIAIRPATPDDAATVAALMTAFNRVVGVMGGEWGNDTRPEVADVSEAQARARLTAMAATERVYLATAGGQAAGLAALRLVPHLDQDAPYAELTQIYVAPAYRRHGVAATLIAHVEAEAKAAGATAVYLLTGIDNPNAHAFYRAAGYQPHYVGFDKYLGEAQ